MSAHPRIKKERLNYLRNFRLSKQPAYQGVWRWAVDRVRDSPIKPATPPAISYLQIWAITWPIILSNLSTPLLGLVDTAVIGNLGDAALIGAIAIGAMIFSFLYWGFGFLRMGTTGMVAQALGAGKPQQAWAVLYRAILIGTVIGILLLVLQAPMANMVLSLTGGSPDVESSARVYFDIRIWSAPATLTNLAILGYFLGRQDSRTALFLQLFLNGSNILLDLVFVIHLGWGVEGVASATLIAEFGTLMLGILLLRQKAGGQFPGISVQQLFDWPEVRRTLVVNSDIMIRTLCLIFAFAWFTNQGAKSSDTILAVNTLLMQFVSFAAFFLDGYALACETLVGHGTGERNKQHLRDSIKRSTLMSLVTAIVISLLFYQIGLTILKLMTNIQSVINTSLDYLPWVIICPIISVWCYQLDGIFIGATRTREMRNAMLMSLAIYLAIWWLLQPFGNHGLWAALIIFFGIRSLTLLFHLNKIFEFHDNRG